MLLSAIQAQIKPLFKQVQGAANVKNAIARPISVKNSPLAFVCPIGERPTNNERELDIGQPLQQVLVSFGVVIGVASINDATGDKALETLETVRAQLQTALLGFSPAGDFEPIVLGNSDLVGFADGGLWWLDRFSTITWRQGVNE